jgi:WD40 repeat protein
VAISSPAPHQNSTQRRRLDLCPYHNTQKIAQSMTSQPPNLIQSSELPPAQPDYVLRGHTAQIHCVHFLRQNLRLLTGDADGWVVLWNFAVKRPVAVWKAHGGSVLGVGSWGSEEENIITWVCINAGWVWIVRLTDCSQTRKRQQTPGMAVTRSGREDFFQSTAYR